MNYIIRNKKPFYNYSGLDISTTTRSPRALKSKDYKKYVNFDLIGSFLPVPCFGHVTISEIFSDYLTADEEGYTEGTRYLQQNGCSHLFDVVGKPIGNNKMQFAAVILK